MRKLRKILGLLIITGIILAGIGGLNLAQAAKTGTFNITITCDFLSITLLAASDESTSYTTWAIADQMSEGASYAMVDNSGVFLSRGSTNVDIDIESYVSSEGGNWTVADSPGTDVFSLVASATTTASAPTVWTDAVSLATSELDITTNITDGTGKRYLYYKFWTPTDNTASGAEQTIEVTVKVTTS